MKKLQVSVVLVCLFIISCHPFEKQKISEPNPVPFEYSKNSSPLSLACFKLTIDSLDNYLSVNLVPGRNLNKFPFPKDTSGTQLTATCFSFTVLYNGRPLGCEDVNATKSFYCSYNKYLNKIVSYNTDTVNLEQGSAIRIRFPFYVLNKLRSGDNELELQCSQNVFRSASANKTYSISASTKDTVFSRYYNYAHVSLINFSVKFRIHVPQIFKTTLYCYGIELRNDSVFSPVGMDNTIWKSSYPDVYWTINYPNEDFYCSSGYQESTSYYNLKDTFHLFHYTPYDSISLGVWDHDNLSRDDYIAYSKFSLKQFPQNKIVKLRFDNVKAFELRMVKGYAVNR